MRSLATLLVCLPPAHGVAPEAAALLTPHLAGCLMLTSLHLFYFLFTLEDVHAMVAALP
jgi:hypothetical protein